MREGIKSQLLEGLEDRIAAGATRADRVMRRELLAEIDDWFDREAVSVSPWLQGDYRRMLEPVRAHAQSRAGFHRSCTRTGGVHAAGHSTGTEP